MLEILKMDAVLSRLTIRALFELGICRIEVIWLKQGELFLMNSAILKHFTTCQALFQRTHRRR